MLNFLDDGQGMSAGKNVFARLFALMYAFRNSIISGSFYL